MTPAQNPVTPGYASVDLPASRAVSRAGNSPGGDVLPSAGGFSAIRRADAAIRGRSDTGSPKRTNAGYIENGPGQPAATDVNSRGVCLSRPCRPGFVVVSPATGASGGVA